MWSHSTIEWDEGSSCTAHHRHLEIFSKLMVLLLSCCTRKLLFRVLQSRRSSACCPLVVQRRYMSHRPGKQLPFFCLASLLACLFFYKMTSDMAVFLVSNAQWSCITSCRSGEVCASWAPRCGIGSDHPARAAQSSCRESNTFVIIKIDLLQSLNGNGIAPTNADRKNTTLFNDYKKYFRVFSRNW